MSSTVVIGCMYGDEAKAKIVDFLSEDADAVIRFQGGSNAGHTIKTDQGRFVLHSIPSGILYPGKICVLGSGMVLDISALKSEMSDLSKSGIDFTGRFFIDPRVHLVLPIHKDLDKKLESDINQLKIGTTRRGIGPCYSDKAARVGIRYGDIFDDIFLGKRLENLYDYHKINLTKEKKDKLIEDLVNDGNTLKEYLIQVPFLLNEMYESDKKLLFEGAQGSLLDIGFGTYPYVTSSHTLAAAIGIGCGFPPKKLDKIIGVYKSYFTRVGEGPFPTELNDATGEKIREQGNEYGASTGRPRRCGWFDAVAARYSAVLNGVDEIALTLLDVLGGFNTIKICTNYIYEGKKISQFPYNIKILNDLNPEYIELPGWKEDISDIREYNKLPQQAKKYVEEVEKLLEKRVSIISVGPRRDQTILK